MKKISKEWKKDSLAGNGYRVTVFKKLRNCKLDNISGEYLISMLGRPTEIKRYEEDTYFMYRYYDYTYIDTATSKWKGYGWDTISFILDKKTSLIIDIADGTGEY